MVMYIVYQGKVYEYDVVPKDTKYIFSDNILSLLSVSDKRLDRFHGKGLEAYVISKDVDKAIKIYTDYMSMRKEVLKEDLRLYDRYLDVEY